MPDDVPAPLLDLDRYLHEIEHAADALADRAASADWTTRVPTCPAWTVADLVAHQGMVHRWAASNLRRDGARVPSKTAILRTVPRADLLTWFRDGARELVDTLTATAPDAAAMVFLEDAPSPRTFWARRQTHETTIHSVDALAAALGRVPTAAEADLDRDLAVDGIDELLRGFVTRGKGAFADDAPFAFVVRPSDAVAGWVLRATPDGNVTDRIPPDAAASPHAAASPGDRGTPAPATTAHSPDAVAPPSDRGTSAPAATTAPPPDTAPPDAVFTGTAAQLYLGLWNRGEEIGTTGRADLRETWRKVRVRW